MDLQCEYCHEMIVLGVRHDCYEVVATLRADLAAAVARAEEAERQLCKARDYLLTIKSSVENVAGAFIGYVDIDTMIDNLYQSSPCRHEAEADALRAAVEWALENIPMTQNKATELRRRAGGEGSGDDLYTDREHCAVCSTLLEQRKTQVRRPDAGPVIYGPAEMDNWGEQYSEPYCPKCGIQYSQVALLELEKSRRADAAKGGKV